LYQCGHELGKMVGMQLPEEVKMFEPRSWVGVLRHEFCCWSELKNDCLHLMRNFRGKFFWFIAYINHLSDTDFLVYLQDILPKVAALLGHHLYTYCKIRCTNTVKMCIAFLWHSSQLSCSPLVINMVLDVKSLYTETIRNMDEKKMREILL
jgi:hypothetical protein